jgi:hypothetical protein
MAEIFREHSDSLANLKDPGLRPNIFEQNLK